MGWVEVGFNTVSLVELISVLSEMGGFRYAVWGCFGWSPGRFRILRLVLPARLIVMHRNGLGIRVMVMTFKRAGSKLILAIFFLFIFNVIFAALLYTCELGEWDPEQQVYLGIDGSPSQFTDMLECIWVVMVTM